MNGRKETLYDVLGIRRDASQSDVVRAYRRLMREMAKESAAPNPRREALLHEACEVLSDAARREQYDRSLRGQRFLGIEGGQKPRVRWAAILAALALALGGLAWFFFRGPEEGFERPAGASLSPVEVQAAALVAIGRIDRVEMSGARTPVGMAVAVEPGVMIAPCKGIRPGEQIVVRIAPRDLPAQLQQADQGIGLCKLAVSGGGSWPLPMTAIAPRPGDTIYAAGMDAKGEVVIAKGEVKRLDTGSIGHAIETTARAGPPVDGSPLLDAEGRVVAIALGGKHMMLPQEWLVDIPAGRRPQPPREPPAEPEKAEAAAPALEEDPRLGNVPPERRKRLEEAFRPPPRVPDDP